MAKILISPSKYVQGAGKMKNIGKYAAAAGKKALVLISPLQNLLSDLPCQVWVMLLQLILRQEHAREVKQLPVQAETQQVRQWHWQSFVLIL